MMKRKERKFFVNGKVYTLFEYGYYTLLEFHNESNGETVHPKEMNKDEIEEWALSQLEDAMKQEDEEIYEIR